MKATLLFACVLPIVAAPEEIRLPLLKVGTNTYKNAVISRRTPSEAVVRYDGGIKKVAVTNLVELPEKTKEVWFSEAKKADTNARAAKEKADAERAASEKQARIEADRKAETVAAVRRLRAQTDAPVEVRSSNVEMEIQNTGREPINRVELTLDREFLFVLSDLRPWSKVTIAWNDFTDDKGRRFKPLDRRPDSLAVKADDYAKTLFVIQSR